MKEFEYDDLPSMALTRWGWSQAAVRLPSDRTCVEALDGPCHTYHLGKPMKLQQLEAMPKDLQLAYLRKLRRHGGTRESIGKMLGIKAEKLDTLGVSFDMPNPAAWAEFLGQC